MMVWVRHISQCVEVVPPALLHRLSFEAWDEGREGQTVVSSITMLGVAESVDERPLGCLDVCVWLQLFPVTGRGTQNLSQSRIHDKITRACPWRVGVIIPHL